MAKNPRRIDIEGQRFGRWTVGKQAGNVKGGGALWHATCDCGEVRVVIGADVRKGKSVSCGCYKAEVTGERYRTHGEAHASRLHRIWINMRRRCLAPTNPSYKNYGGRGITICAEWSRYETFRDWALAHGYSDALSIERVDVNGNYCPENCTWADAKTQSRNRRFVKRAPDGTPWPAIAEANGIPPRTYNTRVGMGWPHEEAATWPYRTYHKPRERNAKGQFG